MRLLLAALAGGLLWQADAALAQEIHGRLFLEDSYSIEDGQSVTSSLGDQTWNDGIGQLRLTWEPHYENLDFSFHYVIGADWGDTASLTRSIRDLGILPPGQPTTWFDLTDTFVEQRHLTATQGIDRLAVGFTDPNFVVRVGRQALTWGSGLVFHPMDLFDPFAPNATDVDYKPGTDMVYGQYLFANGSDLQAVVVPRPDHVGGWPTGNATSYAVHWHGSVGSLQTTLMAAGDYGDPVAGLGVNGPLGEATWNVELVPTWVPSGAVDTSGLANILDAVHILDRDTTIFGEYYRNGFGLGGSGYSINQLPLPLSSRLARGQIFDTGRDYLATGAIFHWTPLLHIDPTLITNLDDRSLFSLIQSTYSLQENLNLVVGAQVPIGSHGTEFGGLPLTPQSPQLFEHATLIYVQLKRYF